MLSFHSVVKADFEAVNRTIIDQLHSDVGLVENIGHYIVDAGGKRLRPLLCLLFAKALRYEGAEHVALATVVEFIHTATLLHDDVVDISALRRGRETANAKWGNAPSVLVGDFLYSRAFQMLVAIGNMHIMEIFSNTTNVIAEGEVQQLVNAKDPSVSEANYMTVIHKKTAALFEAACETSTVLAGGSEKQKASAKRYGYHLGVAFQLIDDVLDYAGDAEAMGKNIGDDLAEGKPTLPLIHTMAEGEPATVELIQDAIRNGRSEKLDDILAAVRSGGGLEYTKQKALEHVNQAKQALNDFEDSEYKRACEELATFSIERSF